MAKKMIILVVDDNIINRQYFSMALKKSGYEVITAESGSLAIENARLTKFDVILMDIRMPEMDGYECTDKIKKISLQKLTPIYATSAEELLKGKGSQFNGFLLKPISPKQLNDIISRHSPQNTISFDQQQALNFAYNDMDIVKQLAGLFIQDFPIQFEKLKQHIAQNEFTSGENIIHKMKGSCKACGAQQIDEILTDISDSINDENFNFLSNKLTLLSSAISSYKNIIKSL